jgi:hypothetical protein
MPLPTEQQRALDGIGADLAASGPKLARMFTVFGRLYEGEPITLETLPRHASVSRLAGRLLSRRSGASGNQLKRTIIGRWTGSWGSVATLFIVLALVVLAFAYAKPSSKHWTGHGCIATKAWVCIYTPPSMPPKGTAP